MAKAKKFLPVAALVLLVGGASIVPFSNGIADDGATKASGPAPAQVQYDHWPTIQLADADDSIFEYALNPEHVDAILFAEQGDTEGRARMMGLIEGWIKGGSVRLENWTTCLGTDLVDSVIAHGYDAFGERVVLYKLGFVGMRNPSPPEICIKLRDCSLWCDGPN